MLAAIHELLDVDSFVNFFILRELFGDLDGFRRSMNFYVNSDDKLVIGPVWDLDGGSGAVRFSVITPLYDGYRQNSR